MTSIIQLALPVVVILAFIVFKLNHEQKRWLFKIPVWISSTVISLGIGHFARGVMGFYGAAICDLFLYPAMLLVKKAWKMKEERRTRLATEARSMPLSLPVPATA